MDIRDIDVKNGLDTPVVAPGKWGRDHWRALLFAEARAVDHDGKLDNQLMRTNPARHPTMKALQVAGREIVESPGTYKHPTVLSDDSKLSEHDDWDCISDFEVAGLLVTKNVELAYGAVEVNITLTGRGWKAASLLRRYRAENRSVEGFKAPSPKAARK